jgi:iron complex outermembrane receptor protein
LLAALFASGPLYAQTGQVTGAVTSAEGRALSGANVSVVGGGARAVTGPDGRYSLDRVNAGTVQVAVTTLGYAPATRSVTVTAGQTATANFTLQSAAVALQGVVAVGYGERRVRDVTGAVQSVSSEEFNTGRVVSPEQLIQGKVAGVQVVTSGEPGGGSSVRIRGGTSINASNEPLYVIDGVPLEAGGGLSAGRNPLNFINPQDISRVTVLKDASSTAIYGSRGANGVIIIETRTGSQGGPAFSYSTSLSTSSITGEPDMLTADQLRSVVAKYAPGRVQYLGNANTDWRSAVERDGFGQEHALAVSGSGQAMNYRLSLNYLNQDGVLQGSTVERTSAALNYNHRLFEDRLNIRASLRGARTEDRFTPGSVLGSATNFDPTQPIQTDAGFFEQKAFTLAPNNPVAELAGVVDQGTTYRSVGSLESRYRMPFLEALSGTVRLGYDVAKSERRSFFPTTLQSQIESPNPGSVSRSNPTETTGLLDAFLTYQKRLGGLESDVDATAGYSYQSTSGEYPSFYANGLSSNLLGINGVPTATINSSTIFVRDTKLASFFGRVNWTLLDRYLLTLSVRRDGSSRFGPDNQWGVFPAAALAWRVNEEPWFGGFSWLSDLKLRGSWGKNGNQAIGDYLWAPQYTYGNEFAQVQFGNTFVTTIRPTAVDPNIKWEETSSYNLGLDYGLFDNRVTGAIEYYVKNTSDLLFRIPVPAGTNLSNFVTTNIGSMRNTGLELSVNAQVLPGRNRGLSWNASFNASTNKNRLTAINPLASGSQRILVGGIAGGVGSTIQVLQPGTAVNSFFVYHHIRDANGKPVYADVNGDHVINDKDLYEDRNGDGNITQDDRAPFHSPTPTWILAHTSNLGYRSLDASFTLRASLGNYAYNNLASSQGWYNLENQASGPINLHASVLENGFVEPQFFSDVYVEDASFLRMDNITLGYTLPRIHALDSARIYGTVQNVFTLTGYSGVDPEAGLFGIDNNIYPRSRTFSVGVSLGF